jgi:PAS domain S-box-containing protein
MVDLASGGMDLDDVLHRTARFARELSGADEAGVFLYDDDGKSVVPAAGFGPDGPTSLVGEKIALRVHEGSIFADVREENTVLEVLEPVRLRDIIDLSRFASLYLAPMAAEEGVLGVLLLGYHGSNSGMSEAAAADGTVPSGPGGGAAVPGGAVNPPRVAATAADAQMRRLFAAVARQAAVVISRARLFSTLEKSEEQYRRLTENASDIVFSLDASGRFTFLNSRVFDILGYKPTELAGQYYSEIVTAESWDAARKALRACLDAGGSQVAYEWKAVSKSGETVLLDVRASVLRRDGQYAGQQGIARDVTEQRRMEQEIKRSRQRQSEMRDYLALVTRVQEEERKRVARELHDDTAQALVALSRRLEMTLPYVRSDPDQACERLEQLARLADTALENLRRFTRDLRPPVLDDLGLIPALEWLASDMQANSRVRVTLAVTGNPTRLPSDTETAVFRIAQEALNNVQRHSGAGCATVRVRYDDRVVELIVEDDGKGFDVEGGAGRFASTGRFGLVGMNERAQLVGGRLTVSSLTGKGTRVHLEVPLEPGESGKSAGRH